MNSIELTPPQREALETLVARHSERAGVVRRARVVLWTADGLPATEIATRLDLSAEAVSRIRRRFLEGGVDALADQPKTGRQDHALDPSIVERIVEIARSHPPKGRTRWTTRLIGRELGLSSSTVSKVLRSQSSQRVRHHRHGRESAFLESVEDILGLYLNPPEHAVVLSGDEKTSTRSAECRESLRGLRSRRTPRLARRYRRHGVVDLYAALEQAADEAHRLGEAHAATDFRSFMSEIVCAYPDRELHVVVDVSKQATLDIEKWGREHPRVRFHYTRTSTSWLSQVEGWLGVLAKQSLFLANRRPKHTLCDHLHACLRAWNRHSAPFAWTKPARVGESDAEAKLTSSRRRSERRRDPRDSG